MLETLAFVGAGIAYVGCALLFQSGERRVRHPAVVVPKPMMDRTRYVGWAMLPASWACFFAEDGLEIGTAIWLGVLALAGIVSLIVTAIVPKFHMVSLELALSASLAFFLMALWQGGIA